MKAKLILLITTLGLTASISRADNVIIDFTDSSITGGSLNLLSGTTGSTTDFTSARFEGRGSADFEITGLPTYGTLSVTAEALDDDLNITGQGLADGGSGYDNNGEGTSFIFDQDVTITGFDFAGFSTATDQVILRNGLTNLGTFTAGSNSGGFNFSDGNNVTMSVTVSSGNAFILEHTSTGDYDLERLNFTVIPEPSSIALIGLSALALALSLRNRKK